MIYKRENKNKTKLTIELVRWANLGSTFSPIAYRVLLSAYR